MRPWALFLGLTLGLSVVFLIVRRDFYFASPIHEHGDAALNALQINRAKHGAELHGNYSRFRFHHPGPAFFYAYAGAEIVLVDLLPTGLTPANAHALAGLLIQSACFALALVLLAQWGRRPLLVAVMLLCASIHFALADYAFWSIWPPHVLLMPFLAFWISCLSVSCGRGEHLVWAVLTGSLLVHSHVAQPLFVGTIFPAAYALLWWRHGRPWRRHRRAHLWAGAVLLLFLLPLLLDLARGPQSNFHEILRHLRDNGEQLKKPLKSLLYLASFFGYVHDQDVVLRELSPRSLGMFREHAPAFLGWLLLLPASVAAWRSLARQPGESGVFWRHGAWLWLATLGLGLLWGIAQTGRMAEFNSYFFHSVTYVALLPVMTWLAERLPASGVKHRLAGAALLLAAAAGAWVGFGRGALTPGEHGRERLTSVLRALESDSAAPRAKLLVFAPYEWPEAAAVALALERAGVPYYVDQPWEFMHPGRVLPPGLLTEPTPAFSAWRILPAGAAVAPLPLRDGRSLKLGMAPLSADGGGIDFATTGNYLAYTLVGFANRQGLSAWMSQPHAAVQFAPDPADHDVLLTCEARLWAPGGGASPEPLSVHFNDAPLAAEPVAQAGRLVWRVPRALWNSRPVATLRWHLPGARDPMEEALPSDWRGGSAVFRRLTTSPVRGTGAR